MRIPPPLWRWPTSATPASELRRPPRVNFGLATPNRPALLELGDGRGNDFGDAQRGPDADHGHHDGVGGRLHHGQRAGNDGLGYVQFPFFLGRALLELAGLLIVLRLSTSLLRLVRLLAESTRLVFGIGLGQASVLILIEFK